MGAQAEAAPTPAPVQLPAAPQGAGRSPQRCLQHTKSCKKYMGTTGFEADILGAGNTQDEISKMNFPSMRFTSACCEPCSAGVAREVCDGCCSICRQAERALQPQRREGRNAGGFPKRPGSNYRRLTEKPRSQPRRSVGALLRPTSPGHGAAAPVCPALHRG